MAWACTEGRARRRSVASGAPASASARINRRRSSGSAALTGETRNPRAASAADKAAAQGSSSGWVSDPGTARIGSGGPCQRATPSRRRYRPRFQRGRASPGYCRPTLRSTRPPGKRRHSPPSRAWARCSLSPPRAVLSHSGVCAPRSVKVGSEPTQIAVPKAAMRASWRRTAASNSSVVDMLRVKKDQNRLRPQPRRPRC